MLRNLFENVDIIREGYKLSFLVTDKKWVQILKSRFMKNYKGKYIKVEIPTFVIMSKTCG